MPEYIDKEKLIASVVNNVSGATETTHDFLTGSAYRQNEIIDIIKEQPAANVVEVKHGEWEQKPSRLGGAYTIFACSVCDKAFTFHPNYDFCPGCGADMRKKEGAENG